MRILNMIVKNESRVIERCFNSLKDYVDGIVISDTGSKDVEFSITHTLNRIPVGRIVVSQDKAGELYDSDRSNWTSTAVKYKFSESDNAALRIIIF